MKKKSIVNLIKYYSEQNFLAFHHEAEEIAKDFDRAGDSEIAGYIMSLLSNNNVFVPQICDDVDSMFEKIDIRSENLWLPDEIAKDLMGIVNAVSYHTGINKFLFKGLPGTGKTEAVKQVSKILNRDLFMVNISGVIDSKLGNTVKNIHSLFEEINHFLQPKKLVILFDELDALAMNRIDQQDHREMGRATSGLLRELDKMNKDIVLIATTNLYDCFDKALIRRFDAIIDFDRYTDDYLRDIAEKLLEKYLKEYKMANKDIRLFRKIYSHKTDNFSPGELKNVIRSAVAFSNPCSEQEYMQRLFDAFCPKGSNNIKELNKQGFTIREISVLVDKSKSSVDRELRENV